jgi:hypothetical protein
MHVNNGQVAFYCMPRNANHLAGVSVVQIREVVRGSNALTRDVKRLLL